MSVFGCSQRETWYTHTHLSVRHAWPLDPDVWVKRCWGNCHSGIGGWGACFAEYGQSRYETDLFISHIKFVSVFQLRNTAYMKLCDIYCVVVSTKVHGGPD